MCDHLARQARPGTDSPPRKPGQGAESADGTSGWSWKATIEVALTGLLCGCASPGPGEFAPGCGEFVPGYAYGLLSDIYLSSPPFREAGSAGAGSAGSKGVGPREAPSRGR